MTVRVTCQGEGEEGLATVDIAPRADQQGQTRGHKGLDDTSCHYDVGSGWLDQILDGGCDGFRTVTVGEAQLGSASPVLDQVGHDCI